MPVNSLAKRKWAAERRHQASVEALPNCHSESGSWTKFITRKEVSQLLCRKLPGVCRTSDRAELPQDSHVSPLVHVAFRINYRRRLPVFTDYAAQWRTRGFPLLLNFHQLFSAGLGWRTKRQASTIRTGPAVWRLACWSSYTARQATAIHFAAPETQIEDVLALGRSPTR